jgi:hypothetical protein
MKTLFLTLALVVFGFYLLPQKVHLISALASDSSIYSRIVFDSTLSIHHVKWIKPIKQETIEQYSERLITENGMTKEDIVIGTSFGGLVATEICKQLQPRLTILISSISMKHEKPLKFKFLNVLKLHKIIPKALLNNPNLVIKNCFGKVSPDEKEFLTDMLRKSDVKLAAWSIDQVIKYDNNVEPSHLIKINGLKDKTFHAKNIDTDYFLDGTHMMVYNKPMEISLLLNYIIRHNKKKLEQESNDNFLSDNSNQN